MIIYGFYGLSGTGKSALIIKLLHQYDAYDFIDDGIYVHNGQKIAGTSAKYEDNKIAAIKRAIFYNLEHAKEVKCAINRYNPEKLFILGTSKKMIEKIADKLELPMPEKWISIEEVSTKKDIQQALLTRKFYGQHVIPIPLIQIEKDKFHQIIEKIKSIFDSESKLLGETTIVYPKFQGGRVRITFSTLHKMTYLAVTMNEHVYSVDSIYIPDNLYEQPISLKLSLKDNQPIPKTCYSVQKEIIKIYKKMINITIPTPNIYVKKLIISHIQDK